MSPTGSPIRTSCCSTVMSAPIRRSTSTNAIRDGLSATPSRTISEPGVMHAATTKNAADDGSPGTSSSKGPGAPDSTRTVPFAVGHGCAQRGEHALGVITAGDGFDDLGRARCLEAGEHERALHLRARNRRRWRPVSAPPRTTTGAKVPFARASITAPIVRSGSTTRAIGRRRSDSSPSSTERNGRPASRPVNTRIDVPELAQSTTPSGSRSASTPLAETVRRSGAPLIRTPSSSRLRRVAATSAPVARPVIVLRPSASAANSSAVRDRLVARNPQPSSQRPRSSHHHFGEAHASAPRETWYPSSSSPASSSSAPVAVATSTSTPAPPSPECAISRSKTLTPNRPASVVISASTP